MSTPKDWYDPRHFAYMVETRWQDLLQKAQAGDRLATLKFHSEVRDLANNILRSKRYNLFVEYYQSYTQTRGDKLFFSFYNIHSVLYRMICEPKRKLLMGIAHGVPLWIDSPASAWLDANQPGGRQEQEIAARQIQFFWNTVAPLAINLMPLLTGQAGQAEYDRLIAPRLDKAIPLVPARAILENFDERLCHMLGFDDHIDKDEVLQIQAYAMLEQRYKLVEHRPVVVRLEDNPAVPEVIIMQKGTLLIARCETYRFGDLIQLFDLLDPENCESSFNALMAVAGLEPTTFHGLEALVVSIYRDLVTADEVSAGVRAGFGKSGGRKKKEDEPEKPKTYTTSWQVIPRRLYTNRKAEADITVERERLSEQEEGFRRALRRYHAVVGHVRRYRDRPDFSASYERRQLADGDGIILKNGETYVKPHNRGLSAIEALGEVDLALVPHYLRRGRKE